MFLYKKKIIIKTNIYKMLKNIIHVNFMKGKKYFRNVILQTSVTFSERL